MAAVEYLEKCSKCTRPCHHWSGVCQVCRKAAKTKTPSRRVNRPRTKTND